MEKSEKLTIARDALHESEERFRLLVDSAREYAIFMLDNDGVVASWNGGAERIKGYRADEIIGQHFSVFYTDVDRERGHPADELRLAVENGSYAEEGWRVRKDGSLFWASVVITAVNDGQGRRAGFGKVTRDLTARKRAEEDARQLAQVEAAREMADRLHLAATAFASALRGDDVARAVFATVLPELGGDSGSLAVVLSRSAELQLGWTKGYATDVVAPFQRTSLADRTPHSDAAREKRPIVLESREAINAAYPAITEQNGLAGLLSLPLIVGDACIGVMGVTWRTPRTLTAADRTLALAYADQCALALDRALLFERELAAKARLDLVAEASAIFAETLDDEVILRSLQRLVVPRLGATCTIDAFDGAAPPDAAADGTPRIVVPLVARGRPIALMTLVAAPARSYSADDVAFVADLCRRAAYAVENARLYRDLAMAVRVRDDFVSVAGHEVRTPLAALQLSLETLKRYIAREPALAENVNLLTRLGKAIKNGDRLERLVAELLDVSRVAAGRMTIEPEPMDLSEVVGDVLARMNDGAADVRYASGGSLEGKWDRSRLEQVISNLVGNALKYGRGSPVEVETAREPGFAVLRVRDHGIGITPADQRRIFERFERAVSERNYGGLGLGLWIARQVVEASGGTISVESELGKGAVFTVRLPFLPVRTDHVAA